MTIHRNRIEAQAAEDRFTWQEPLGEGWYRLDNMRRLLEKAAADGAPPDSQVQMGSDRLYVNWTRRV